ncbi:MAG: SDR family NAD(P)-dependent oxidoreductase [Terracidiphilus sp.]|nr:SDR family NAD(P)-dependent oxidoreductase [Terracidiphilus sp.]
MSSFKVLTGKCAMITGAAKGIGAQILESFVAAGADVVACVRTPSDALQQRLDDLSQIHGVRTQMLCIDLMDERAIKQAMQSLYSSRAQIDILVNNAGMANGGFLTMTSMEDVKSAMQVNFLAPLQITQYVAKLMMRRRHGVIINMGSIAGLDSLPGYTAYGSSKAALMQFTKVVANELAPYGIRVNAIAPGLIDTHMAEQMETKAGESMVARSAMKRLGRPQEIADIAVFLASEQSSFINGQIIRADGGG